MHPVRIALTLVLASSGLLAQAPAKKPAAGNAEQRAAKQFEVIKKDPLQLRNFLYRLPKGGDLHNHLSGAIYAESYIQWAAQSGYCISVQTLTYVSAQKANADSKPECAEKQRPATDALTDTTLYRDLIDALSMRNFNPAREAGESHFFDTFGKFSVVSRGRVGEMLAEVAQRAAKENLHYLELIFTMDAGVSYEVAAKVPWQSDLAQYREQLLASGLKEALPKGKAFLDSSENVMRDRLSCGTPKADAGCNVTLRYIFQVLRAMPKERVFAQTLAGFEMAQADPRVVGLNFVQPEDSLVSMRDFDLHVEMLDYLHKQYPNVNIALHAGELTFGQVLPEELGQHIPKSIDKGHAKRIGHGTDVMYYSKPADLLHEMAMKHVAVEVSLSSSDMILGIRDSQHPFREYMQAGVPVVISTDDAGVARSDLTHEYQRAVEAFNLTYAEIKRISMDSLEYSFLPGESLSTCKAATPKPLPQAAGCDTLAKKSEKAAAQWKLQQAFAEFEKNF